MRLAVRVSAEDSRGGLAEKAACLILGLAVLAIAAAVVPLLIALALILALGFLAMIVLAGIVEFLPGKRR